MDGNIISDKSIKQICSVLMYSLNKIEKLKDQVGDLKQAFAKFLKDAKACVCKRRKNIDGTDNRLVPYEDLLGYQKGEIRRQVIRYVTVGSKGRKNTLAHFFNADMVGMGKNAEIDKKLSIVLSRKTLP